MTTHAPYGPDAAATPEYPQHPPTSEYPTAPPWASPPAPEPVAYGAVTPYGAPYQQHGQLLVPFPEEMHNASRPKPPPWWPVLAWTAFSSISGLVLGFLALAFGFLTPVGVGFAVAGAACAVVGIVSASRRANQARRGGNSAAPFWVAWGAATAVLALFSFVALVVSIPVYLSYREGAITTAVESSLKNGTQLEKSANVKATSAKCEPIGPRDTAGARQYTCQLVLADGRTGTLVVSADSDANWSAVPRK